VPSSNNANAEREPFKPPPSAFQAPFQRAAPLTPSWPARAKSPPAYSAAPVPSSKDASAAPPYPSVAAPAPSADQLPWWKRAMPVRPLPEIMPSA
jgi:hypothetical protein